MCQRPIIVEIRQLHDSRAIVYYYWGADADLSTHQPQQKVSRVWCRSVLDRLLVVLPFAKVQSMTRSNFGLYRVYRKYQPRFTNVMTLRLDCLLQEKQKKVFHKKISRISWPVVKDTLMIKQQLRYILWYSGEMTYSVMKLAPHRK